MKNRNYIQEALTKSIIDLFGDDKVIVPNILEDGLQNGFHVELSFIPSTVRVATLGPNGSDDHNGLIQVDIKTTFGTGSAEAKEKVASLEGIFKAGSKICYNTTTVTVQNAREEPSYRDGQWWVTPVSIYWYSRINRGPDLNLGE